MKTIRPLFSRTLTTAVVVLLAILVALPFSQRASATATAMSDDFNRCSLDTSFWYSFENPANISGASPTITGAYTTDAYMSITVPAGTSYTFSNDNMKAPRIWHKISDADFSYEAKFLAPFNEPSTGNYKIMGILVRDNTNTSAPKYFRMDFNTMGGGLNEYIGYLHPVSGVYQLTHIKNVTDLPGGNPTSGPLFLKVSYQKATSTWTVFYQIGASGSLTKTETFTGTTYDANFTVTDIGLFLGSTGSNPPGATMNVDYFRNTADAAFADDNITVNVAKAGTGTGSVNQTCSGSIVSLTANAGVGSTFAGWSGDVSNTNKTIQLNMNRSYNVTATFNGGAPLDLPFDLYLPFVRR